MKFLLLAVTACMVLSGCYASCATGDPLGLFTYCPKESYEALMHPKPYGARWVKEGMTRESRRGDWVACGGENDLKEHYERKSGLTNKEFFDGLEAYRNQLRACMNGKGYVYRNPSMPGVEDECNAGDCLHP